jgi:hypothetical protein
MKNQSQQQEQKTNKGNINPKRKCGNGLIQKAAGERIN